jgi:hypothetical protein
MGVVTDKATFAWLCGVYIGAAARGKGLGTALAAAVRDHLAPYGLRRILLATADAHAVYAKVGSRRRRCRRSGGRWAISEMSVVAVGMVLDMVSPRREGLSPWSGAPAGSGPRRGPQRR